MIEKSAMRVLILYLWIVCMTVGAYGAWRYGETEDKMRNEKNGYAVTENLNKANLRFPYDGGSPLKLFLRRGPRQGQEAFVTVTRGSILCTYGGCTVPVKFDTGKIETFRGVTTADHRSDTIFLEPASKFIARVKKAHKLVIELSFFQEGAHQFEFDVSGLAWK